MTLRWLAVANPVAGAPGSAPRAAERLRRTGLVADVAVTACGGDATRIARASVGCYDGIVSLGGDGTNHEIVTGMDRARQALALMPLGHGNCLARDLGLAVESAAAGALARATESAEGIDRIGLIDLIALTLHYADGATDARIATCSFGVGYVADATATGRGRFAGLGRAAYAAATLVTRPAPLGASLSVDGTAIEAGAFTGVVVNNTLHLANFRALPMARVDDGRLDVIALGGGWLRQLAHNVSIMSGVPLAGPRLERQGGCASITLRAPATAMLDGEMVPGIVRADCTVLPRAVRCVGAA